jgi:hypothetical protein
MKCNILGTLLSVALVFSLASATFTCTVRNAFDGTTVQGALCSLRSTDEATLYGSSTTDLSGVAVIDYSFTINELYLARIGHPDFYVADQVFNATSGSDYSLSISVSPILNSTAIRAVLRWGASPSDLDSHVYIDSTGFSCDHVLYNNKNCLGPTGQVSLDLDDTYVMKHPK